MTLSKELLLERGRAANGRGRYVEAAKHYQEVLAIDEHCAEAWAGQASALEKQGRYSEAMTAYNEARACDPARYGESALFSMGNCHASLGDKAGAVRCYDGVVELNPKGQSAWHNRGMALFELGRDAEAAESFSRAAHGGGGVHSWVWNAHCLSRLNWITEADHSTKRAEQGGDATAVWTAWLEIATHEFQRNNSHSVLTAAEHALAVDTQVGHGWLFRGMALARLGRSVEALEIFDRAIAIKETTLAAWANKAALLEGIGRVRAAAQASEHVVALKPESAEDHLFRARALQLLGRHEEALQSVAIVKRKLGRAGSVWQEEGLALEALGRVEEAVASFQQFLNLCARAGTDLSSAGKVFV